MLPGSAGSAADSAESAAKLTILGYNKRKGSFLGSTSSTRKSRRETLRKVSLGVGVGLQSVMNRTRTLLSLDTPELQVVSEPDPTPPREDVRELQEVELWTKQPRRRQQRHSDEEEQGENAAVDVSWKPSGQELNGTRECRNNCGDGGDGSEGDDDDSEDDDGEDDGHDDADGVMRVTEGDGDLLNLHKVFSLFAARLSA